MAILDLQDMEMPESTVAFGSNKSNNRCGNGGPSRFSLLLC